VEDSVEAMKKSELLDLVNWRSVLAAPRYAYGHEQVMAAIFDGAAKVVTQWIDGDYSGELAFAYEFPDGSVAIATDYYGSCSGCDAWCEASDEDAKQMVKSLVGSMRLFGSVSEARDYIRVGIDNEPGTEFSMRAAKNLQLPPLKTEKEETLS
jgi:hypothetical protein